MIAKSVFSTVIEQEQIEYRIVILIFPLVSYIKRTRYVLYIVPVADDLTAILSIANSSTTAQPVW